MGSRHLAVNPAICHPSKSNNAHVMKDSSMATAPQHVSLASLNRDVSAWVDEVARLTQPDHVYWCDGSDAEFHVLQRQLIASKELFPLNPEAYPGCVLSRSNPSDVARVEHLTFVCTKDKED